MIYLILSSSVDREIIDKVSPHFSPHSPHSPHLSPYPSSANNIEQLQLILANDTTTSNKYPSSTLIEELDLRSLENKTIGKGSTPFVEVRA